METLTARRGTRVAHHAEIAKAATADPWLERDDPYHPRQFDDLASPQEPGRCGQAASSANAVICPLHDRRYDLADGTARNADDAVTAHTVRLQGERVFVTLAHARALGSLNVTVWL